MPRAKEGKKSVSVYLDDALYKEVKKAAVDEEKPVMDLLAEIIQEWVEKRPRPEARRAKR